MRPCSLASVAVSGQPDTSMYDAVSHQPSPRPCSFRLLNLRQPQRFYFLRDGLALPVFAARSRAVAPLDPGEPTQVHLALTGRPSEVKVLWVSGPVGQPLIRWGAGPQSLDREAPADSTTYTREDMCGAPANSTGWLDPGALHSVVLGDLAPGRRYFYTVGSRVRAFHVFWVCVC